MIRVCACVRMERTRLPAEEVRVNLLALPQWTHTTLHNEDRSAGAYECVFVVPRVCANERKCNFYLLESEVY